MWIGRGSLTFLWIRLITSLFTCGPSPSRLFSGQVMRTLVFREFQPVQLLGPGPVGPGPSPSARRGSSHTSGEVQPGSAQTHTVGERSPPAARRSNDSLPLCFPHTACVCVCVALCIYTVVTLCCVWGVCACECGQTQSSSRQLGGNPHQLPSTTL